MKKTPHRPDPARLLESYAASNRCDKAFAALVEHLNGLVYSSALRRTGNAQLAEEIAQNVFALLARKAHSLRRHPSLTAWALETTRRQSANVMRSERRRRRKLEALTREVETLSLPSNPMDDQCTWKDAVPFLDEALDRLPSQDRKAILQRFYEEKKFKEIAGENGQSEDACKKRVQRALQKLTHLLTSRGVTLSGTAVASLLGAEMARAAPSHVTAAIAPNALAASTSLSTTAVVTNTIQTMSTIKSSSLAVATMVALAALPVSQQIAEGNRLHSELEARERQPETSPVETAGRNGSSRGQSREAAPTRRTPRTAGSLLDELATPVDHRTLAKQFIAASDPRPVRGDPWLFTMVFSRLNSMSEEELDEFRNVLADFPSPHEEKQLANSTIRVIHPGLAESWQETLERIMAHGKGGVKGGLSLTPMSFWAREDPDAALAWYREKVNSGEIFGEGIDTPFERRVFRSLVRTLAKSQPDRAIELYQSRAPELKTEDLAADLTRNLATAMITTGGDDSHIRRMFELHDGSTVAQGTLTAYAELFSFGEGVAFIEQFVTDPGQRREVIIRTIEGLSHPGDVTRGLDSLRDNTPAPDAPGLFRDLGARGAIPATWLDKQEPGPIRDQGHLGKMEHRIESKKFSAAFAAAKKIGDRSLRVSAQEKVGRAWVRHDQAEATERLPAKVLQRIQNQ